MVKWSPSLKKGQAAYVPGLVYQGGRGGSTGIFDPTQKFNPSLPGATSASAYAKVKKTREQPLGGSSAALTADVKATETGGAEKAKNDTTTATATASSAAPAPSAPNSYAPAVSLGDRVASGGVYQGDGAMGLKRVLVQRPPDLQAQRMLLPVNGAEQEIVEAVLAAPVRGAGSSTRTSSSGSGSGSRSSAGSYAGDSGGSKIEDSGPAITADGKLADVVVLCGETGCVLY
jgi:hypothetical protein